MMKDVVETAIKMENDSIAFYAEAAARTKHPFGREMFKGFIKDEKRHLAILQGIFSGMAIDAEFIRPKESIKTVFSELKNEMMGRVDVVENEMDALRIAMKFENEGYDFYKKAAAEAGPQQEKDLLERLALEESDHYAILNETFNFLDHTGQWFMYEERGIVEG